jgi:hypothetical protein
MPQQENSLHRGKQPSNIVVVCNWFAFFLGMTALDVFPDNQGFSILHPVTTIACKRLQESAEGEPQTYAASLRRSRLASCCVGRDDFVVLEETLP